MSRGKYGFAISRTLWNWTFSTPSPDTDAVDDIPLFGLVSETAGLVGSGGTGCTVNDVELAVFPAADSEEETEDIGLFVLVELCVD